jgi:hypothetical protein
MAREALVWSHRIPDFKKQEYTGLEQGMKFSLAANLVLN